MDAIYWITYVAVPVVGGVLGLAGVLGGPQPDGRARALAPVRGIAAAVLLASAAHGTVEFVEIVGGLNAKGRVLFVAIVVAQLGLGAVATLAASDRYAPGVAARTARLRARLERARRKLGALAVVSGLAMVLVRARVWLQIFS